MRVTAEKANELVEDHLWLRHVIRSRYAWMTGFDQDEIESLANFYLVSASRTYDPAHGAKFSSYALMIAAQRLIELCGRRARSQKRTPPGAIVSLDVVAEPAQAGRFADLRSQLDARLDAQWYVEQLAQIDARLASLIVLSNWFDFTNRELGFVFGVDERHIRRMLTIAMDHLKRIARSEETRCRSN